jgi:hypothetical protein
MWATWFSSAGSKQWWSATCVPPELMKLMGCYSGLGHHHTIHFAVEGPEHSRTFVLPELMKSLHCYCRLAHHQYHEFCCWRCWTHVPTANVCPTCISVSFLLLFSHFFWIRVSSFSRSGLELVSIIPLFSEIFIEFLNFDAVYSKNLMVFQWNAVRIDLVWMRRMRYLERSIIS